MTGAWRAGILVAFFAALLGAPSAVTVLGLAICGAATLGILAIAWILLGRRRRGDGRQRLAGNDALRRGAVPRGGTRHETERGGAPTTKQLLGRSARRSRLDPSDDPIIAAMGLSPLADTMPRYCAGQVNPGQGEQPLTKAKRRRS